VKPAPFEYHAPPSAAEAVDLLARFDEGAKLIAGGQSLIPMLALRLATFDHLVDVGRINELRGLERRDGALWIGAGTTEAAVEKDDQVAKDVPLLARATPLIGHFQIRNRGTVGGSIAHADPAAEYPAVALALDADMEAVSPKGRRVIAARDFFDGLWSTSLNADELLTGVSFPVWRGRCGFAVEEFTRRHGDFAVAGAVVALEMDEEEKVKRCAIGLIGLGSTPLRAWEVESELRGRSMGEINPFDMGRAAVDGLDSVPADLHGSAEYRRRVGAEMVARAWRTAAREATTGA